MSAGETRSGLLLERDVPLSHSVMGIRRVHGRRVEWHPWRRQPGVEPVVWWDLRPWLREIDAAADARHEATLARKSTRLMNKFPHHVELAAEAVYALSANQPLDLSLIVQGDDGADFPGRVDVKGCKYWDDPILKHQPASSKRFSAEWYVLVGVMLDPLGGCVFGHASRVELSSAPLRTFVAEFGPMHWIHYSRLRPGLPPPAAGALSPLLDAWVVP